MCALLVEILLPVASVIKFEASLPAVRKFVTMLHPHCFENAKRGKHSTVGGQLGRVCVCVYKGMWWGKGVGGGGEGFEFIYRGSRGRVCARVGGGGKGSSVYTWVVGGRVCGVGGKKGVGGGVGVVCRVHSGDEATFLFFSCVLGLHVHPSRDSSPGY